MAAGQNGHSSINTPYDDVFRTLVVDCSQLLIPVLNEVFDKHFSGNEKIIFEQNEHFVNQKDGSEQKRITDSSFRVLGDKEEKFIFECQSQPDNSMLVRMFEYITQEALDTGEIVRNKLKVKIPHAAVLFLRSRKNTPDKMAIEIETPGGMVSFDIPVMKISNYTIDQIFEKKLYFLIPFVIFLYEKNFAAYEKDAVSFGHLKRDFSDLMERLESAAEQNLISAYYWRVIMDMSKRVLVNIARKYRNVREGVETIMGGHVIEHEGKKIYNEGLEAGLEAGMEAGVKAEKQRLVVSFYRMGLPVETIAEGAGISVELARAWIELSEKEPAAG